MTKEFIISIPKEINGNGCWIPINQRPYSDGYCHIKIYGIIYSIHRLSMCAFYDIDYDNWKFITRHSKECSRACFNPEHLKPGTDSDNIKDEVEHGVHRNSSKKVCPKCETEYETRTIKTGWNRGKVVRVCRVCEAVKNYMRKYRGNT